MEFISSYKISNKTVKVKCLNNYKKFLLIKRNQMTDRFLFSIKKKKKILKQFNTYSF